MSRSDPTLKRWYRIFNKKWFGNSLPRLTKVFYAPELESSETARHLTYGEADWTKEVPVIRIHPRLREQTELKTIAAEALLHEMAHLEEFRQVGGGQDHGKAWERVMLRLAKAGAFSKKNGVVPNSLW